MDFRETFRELWTGCIYLWQKVKGKEPTIDKDARRFAHYESAFEKPRGSGLGAVTLKDSEKREKAESREGKGRARHNDSRDGTLPEVEIEREEYVDIGGTRQWLGYGKNYGYGIHRDPSEGLEAQIERELERRGYGSRMFPCLAITINVSDFLLDIPGRGHIKPLPIDDGIGHVHQPQKTWWRSLYERVSQTGRDDDIEDRLTGSPSKRSSKRASRSKSKHHRPSRSRSRQRSRDIGADKSLLFDYHYEDQPPPSLLKKKPGQMREYDSHYYSGLPGRIPRRNDPSSPPSSYPDHPSLPQPRQLQRQPPYRHDSPGSPSRPNFLSHSPSHGLERDRVFPTPAPSSPPPQSLLPPNFARSNDSLLDRVFPPSNVSHIDLMTDSTHAGLGRYGPLGQPSSTTTPTTEHAIGMAGERSYLQYQNAGGTPSSGYDISGGLSAQVIHLGDPPLRFPTPPSNVEVNSDVVRNHTPTNLRHEPNMNVTTLHDSNDFANSTSFTSSPAPPSQSLTGSYPNSSSPTSPPPSSSPRSPGNPRHSSGALRRSSAMRNESPRGGSSQPQFQGQAPRHSRSHQSRRHGAAPYHHAQQVQMPQHTYMPHPQDRRRSVPVKLTVPAPLAPQQTQGANRGYEEGRGW